MILLVFANMRGGLLADRRRSVGLATVYFRLLKAYCLRKSIGGEELGLRVRVSANVRVSLGPNAKRGIGNYLPIAQMY